MKFMGGKKTSIEINTNEETVKNILKWESHYVIYFMFLMACVKIVLLWWFVSDPNKS